MLSSWSVPTGAPAPWLRPIAVASPAQATDVLNAYNGILTNLDGAYERGDMEDAAQIVDARTAMMRLDAEAENLAAAGLGVPFF